jgi:ribosomal-protein-alanine N-acetyltransferase
MRTPSFGEAPKLETLRCTLSGLEAADEAGFLRLRTDPEVRRYLGGPADEERVRRQFDALVAARAQANAEAVAWALRVDGSFAGLVTLDRHPDGEDHAVSFELLPEYCGRGYAREAVEAVLEHARDSMGWTRVVAETQVANGAARRLLLAIGMTEEGRTVRFGEEQVIYAVG